MSEVIAFFYIIAILWLIMMALERKGLLPGQRVLVFILLRTQNGTGLIDRISRFRRFWVALGTLGAFFGVMFMFLMTFGILYSLYQAYFAGVSMAKPQLVIPGYTIPLGYGLIGLVSVLVIHEFSHGIAARAEGIEVKSMGALLLTLLPIGAFVEPDEEDMKNRKLLTKLRVYSAGSLANITLAIMAIMVFGLLATTVFDENRIQIMEVETGSPAEGLLVEGMVLERIGGSSIGSMQDFIDAAQEIRPESDLVIGTDKGSFTIHTAAREGDTERGYVGIKVQYYQTDFASSFLGLPMIILYSLYWIAFLNQAIGLINLAPLHMGIAATDGAQILRELLAKVMDNEAAEKISFYVSFSLMGLLIFWMVAPPANAF
jgi:membrane-associated protease RseP (regulator of RpoE activity)